MTALNAHKKKWKTQKQNSVTVNLSKLMIDKPNDLKSETSELKDRNPAMPKAKKNTNNTIANTSKSLELL